MPAIHVGSEDHRLASGKASRKENKKKEKNPNQPTTSGKSVSWPPRSGRQLQDGTVILVFESGPRKSIDFDSLARANQDLGWISRMWRQGVIRCL